MAKRDSKPAAPARKGKKTKAHNKSKILTRTKPNKLHQKKHKPNLASEPTGHALLDIITSSTFLLADPNCHSAFIGKTLTDTLNNISDGIALLADTLTIESQGLSLPDDTSRAVLLTLDNLKRAVMVERDRYLGSS